MFYYWRVELIEPSDPDDDRYVMIHGDDGEILGPMTVQMAQDWINRYDGWRAPHSREPTAEGR